MVREIKENGTTLYQCEECELKYKDEAHATQCEAWCKAHKSCNLDIISHAEKV